MSKKIAVVCWVTDDYVDYIGLDEEEILSNIFILTQISLSLIVL